MNPEQIYAIVDIEATGGSIGADERIIQFACVLVKDNEIIHTFETLVNPGRNIPQNITALTGISNKDVRTAPYFEEVAPIILRFFDDAIFVAHNVGFDYRFLNEQLRLHDFEELNIPAIDTVELTQILFPDFDSFQLEDIAAALDYDLTDAHDALADARATVHIFHQLFEKAISLPLVTLEKLNDLAACTTHSTHLFFEESLYVAKKNVLPLSDDLVIVNHIALRKPLRKEVSRQEISVQEYPVSEEQKQALLTNRVSYRPVQAEMMDLIYDYFREEFSLEKLAIEVPPGVGKSLGYLMPAIFIAKANRPVVISTYTTVLQDQLLQQSIPLVEEVLERKIDTVLVKSSQHYISLAIFERWLKNMQASDSEAYLAMRILVWLTQTITGDLSEINAGSHLDLTFWQDIRSTDSNFTDAHWQDYDFFARIKEQAENAEIIITNHHFLAHDWQKQEPLLKNLEHLIVDEAHHFPDVATQSNTINLGMNELSNVLEKMGSISNETGIFRLINYLAQKEMIRMYDMQVLARNVRSLQELWPAFATEIAEYFSQLELKHVKDSKFVEHEFSLNVLTLRQKKWRKNILTSVEELILVGQKILKQTMNTFDTLGDQNQLMLIEFSQLLFFLKDWHTRLRHNLTFDKEASNVLRWVSFIPTREEQTLTFHTLKWGNQSSLIDYLATHSKVVFTSSTLSFQNSEDYFSSQLKYLPLTFHQLESPYNYDKQVKVMLPEKRINPKEVHKNDYPKVLAKNISKILQDTKVNTIVLFRSLEVLTEVYELLSEDKKLSDQLILAQSISGTRNRILKNFKRNKPAVILGADSFFEGIDLPDQDLELIILTRLPFPAPNTPLTRLKTENLKEQGVHPFMGEFLPQAVLKYKQAFGRLIRKPSDAGVMVVLDDRLLSASYAKSFEEALPNGVSVEIYPLKAIGKQIKSFLFKNEQAQDREKS